MLNKYIAIMLILYCLRWSWFGSSLLLQGEPGEPPFLCARRRNGPHSMRERIIRSVAYGILKKMAQWLSRVLSFPMGGEDGTFWTFSFLFGVLWWWRAKAKQTYSLPTLTHSNKKEVKWMRWEELEEGEEEEREKKKRYRRTRPVATLTHTVVLQWAHDLLLFESLT